MDTTLPLDETPPLDETLRPALSLLSAEQVGRIVDQAYEVLATVGVEVQNADARALLAEAGQRLEGGRDAFAAAAAEVDRILAKGCPAPLAADVERELDALMAAEAARLGVDAPPRL